MEAKRITPMKAIRLKCLDCMCGSFKEVELCPCIDCSLHPFRFGKNPYNKPREYSEEYKKELTERVRRGAASHLAKSKPTTS